MTSWRSLHQSMFWSGAAVRHTVAPGPPSDPWQSRAIPIELGVPICPMEPRGEGCPLRDVALSEQLSP